MKEKICFSVFCALLIAGSCCFFAASFRAGRVHALSCNTATASESGEAEVLNEELFSKPAFVVLNLEGEEEIICASYRNPKHKEEVLAFFLGITGSEEVTKAILHYASEFDIPPALAFALCAEESAYNPRALNRNLNETVDRGLFQLNSASFPKLSIDEFYDTDKNVKHGLSHLRWCLNTAGTEVAGLAMYNAGAARVSSIGTPKRTLDYVSRILKRQRKIEELFAAEYVRFACSEETESKNISKAEKTSLRLSLLTPLGGRRRP